MKHLGISAWRPRRTSPRWKSSSRFPSVPCKQRIILPPKWKPPSARCLAWTGSSYRTRPILSPSMKTKSSAAAAGAGARRCLVATATARAKTHYLTPCATRPRPRVFRSSRLGAARYWPRHVGRLQTALLAAGFRTAELVATLAGEPLYAASGYTVVERYDVPMTGGLTLPVVRMAKCFA